MLKYSYCGKNCHITSYSYCFISKNHKSNLYGLFEITCVLLMKEDLKIWIVKIKNWFYDDECFTTSILKHGNNNGLWKHSTIDFKMFLSSNPSSNPIGMR